jgi:hypothetical protein
LAHHHRFPAAAVTAAPATPPALEARSLYRFYRAGDEETLALQGVSLRLEAEQNGDCRTDLANHGVVVPAAAAAPASTGVALPWRCNMVTNTTAYRPTIAE